MREPESLPQYDSGKVERVELPTEHEDVIGADWKYDFIPVESRVFSDYELCTVGEKGNIWMGKNARNRIENSRKGDSLYVGYTEQDGKIRDLSIDYEALSEHVALFGQSGYGKSTLMRNMLLQLINSGHGVCYIDPKGDDSNMLMNQIPSERTEDVVWIEPGSDRDSQVGFNIFETALEEDSENYEEEVSRISGDFVALIDESNDWSSDVRNILEDIVERLIYSRDDANPTDLLKVLNLIVGNDDSFSERFVKLKQRYDEVLDNSLMMRFANQGDWKFGDALKRLRQIIRSRPSRSIIASKNSETMIKDAVEDDKLLVVNTSNIQSAPLKEFVTKAIVYKVWSGIEFKQGTGGEQYFLCIDELDKILGKHSRMARIARQSESSRLSLVVANQQPSQLPEEVRDALTEFGSLVSLNPGLNPRDQQEIAQILGGIESWKLSNLDKFQTASCIQKNGSRQDSILMGTYPEYPRLRGSREAEKVIKDSIDKNAGNPDRYLGDDIQLL